MRSSPSSSTVGCCGSQIHPYQIQYAQDAGGASILSSTPILLARTRGWRLQRGVFDPIVPPYSELFDVIQGKDLIDDLHSRPRKGCLSNSKEAMVGYSRAFYTLQMSEQRAGTLMLGTENSGLLSPQPIL